MGEARWESCGNARARAAESWRALAKAMAAQGAAIVANDLGTTLAGDRASTSPANDVVAEIKAAGGKAAPNLMDISGRWRVVRDSSIRR